MNRVLLHLGWPKCASSSLQIGVFSRIPGVQYIGLVPSVSPAGPLVHDFPVTSFLWNKSPHWRNLVSRMLFDENWNSDPEVSIIQNFLAESIDTSKPLVFSHEEVLSARAWSLPILTKIQRLHLVFPNASPLLVTRDREGLLKSLYRDHPFIGDTGRPVSFDDWFQAQLNSPGRHVDATDFGKWAEICREYWHTCVVADLDQEPAIPIARWARGSAEQEDITRLVYDMPVINPGMSAGVKGFVGLRDV